MPLLQEPTSRHPTYVNTLSGAIPNAPRPKRAEAKNALLLKLSDHLQRAITVADVERLAGQSLRSDGVSALELHVRQGGQSVQP
jgi:hypothetical protein